MVLKSTKGRCMQKTLNDLALIFTSCYILEMEMIFFQWLSNGIVSFCDYKYACILTTPAPYEKLN